MKLCLPPFSLIRNFGKQNTRGNISKISASLACYRQIGSKSTNCSHQCSDLLTFSKSCYRAVIGGFRSDLSITRKTDGNFETFLLLFCFPKLRINENGGKHNFILTPFAFDLLQKFEAIPHGQKWFPNLSDTQQRYNKYLANLVFRSVL